MASPGMLSQCRVCTVTCLAVLSQMLVELPSCLSYVSVWTVGTGDLVNRVRPLPIWGMVLRPHKKLLQGDVRLESGM